MSSFAAPHSQTDHITTMPDSGTSSSSGGRSPTRTSTAVETASMYTAATQTSIPLEVDEPDTPASWSELPDREKWGPDGAPLAPHMHVGHNDLPVNKGDGTVVTFPDGGARSWLVVLGASHVLFATFGFVNAWGIFQDYYKEELFPEKTTSEIGWIGSLQYLLIYLPSVVMGRLVDESRFDWYFYTAAVLYPVSVFLTAQVKTYWQAILAHGILFGGTAGVLFCPAIAVVSQWFFERRAFALGVVACSSSIGGTVFPILVSNCLRRVGFAWTMRICGFVLLYCMGFACFTLKTRLPPKSAPGGMFNWAAFKGPAYAIFVFSCVLIQAGLYTPLSYFDVMASQQGLGDYSTYLIAIANACSLIGRIGPAIFADKTGAINFLIPGLVGSAVTTYAWPFCTNKATLTVIACINGVFQGAFVSLLAPGAAALGPVEDVGRRSGMVFSMMSFGALMGAPVAGALLKIGDFHTVSYYAGTMVLAGCILMFISRWLYLGKLKGKL